MWEHGVSVGPVASARPLSPANGLNNLAGWIDRERDAILPEIMRDLVTGRNAADQFGAGTLLDLCVIRCRVAGEHCRCIWTAHICRRCFSRRRRTGREHSGEGEDRYS